MHIVEGKEPLTKFAPRLQKVMFLGFAPNVTNGYFVMRSDDKLELASNIADGPYLMQQVS